MKQDKIEKKDIKELESETKAEDEDYLQIDARFNSSFEQMELDLVSWKDKVQDAKDKSEVEKYFESVFDQFKVLREYINNYTFAIPSTFFSQYQNKLIEYQYNYNKVKDSALPKKKFAFAKKG